MYLPELSESTTQRIMTDNWLGYNHNLRIRQGEWYAEENLSSAYYPLFSQREKRGVIAELESPQGALAKDALLYVDGQNLYYGGAAVDGVTLSTDASMCPKQLVSMGAYCVIFPDKIWINTANLSEYGSLDARYQSQSGASIRYAMCTLDGAEYDLSGATIGPVPPDDPENGDFWIDTGGDVHVLKQYSSSMQAWNEILTTYVRIGVTGIGRQFAEYDGVTVSGAVYAGSAPGVAEQIAALNGDKIVYASGENYIVVAGQLDQVVTQTTGAVSVARECPDMDYVCESGNRLWGCKYGLSDGQTVNEIYACKLGDFKNWRSYAGLSTDSYAVSLGTDGRFTGCIAYQGYPLFFKEDCVHKIYGSMPSEYQVVTTACRGVQNGSAGSLCIVNEVLYYKSRQDVCAFDGSMPTGISDPLGGVVYVNASGGGISGRYYISMQDAAGAWSLFVYDTVRGIWHREDATRARFFTALRGDLVFVDGENRLISATGKSGTPEADLDWYAESGIMGYEYYNQHYLSRYNIRAKLGAGAKLSLYLEYDSEGGWRHMATYTGSALTGTITIPVIPRRCDHMRIRLAGHGDVKIYSIARILEGGSDQSWH